MVENPNGPGLATTSRDSGDADDIILRIEHLDLRFGGTHALDDVSARIGRGQVVGVIGPNGAGKTSLLNCINGFYKPRSGRIIFEGRDIVGRPPYEIARLGFGRTFQNIELIPDATVLSNLMLGRHLHMKTNVLLAALHWGPGRAEEVQHRARVEEIIAFLNIEKIRKQRVASLSHGERRLIEIGRALATEPKVLFLDEPTSGMNRSEKRDVARFILRMKHEMGLTQVLIEHDVRFIGDLCDHVVVLDFGKLIAEGHPQDVLNDPRVIEAYVGTGTTALTR